MIRNLRDDGAAAHPAPKSSLGSVDAGAHADRETTERGDKLRWQFGAELEALGDANLTHGETPVLL